jgi:hypothetical protein
MIGTAAHDGSFSGSAMFLLAVLIPFGLWTLVILARFGRAEAEKTTRAAEQHQWDQMSKNWPKLYYCSLHHLVFRQDRDGTVPIERIQELAAAP